MKVGVARWLLRFSNSTMTPPLKPGPLGPAARRAGRHFSFGGFGPFGTRPMNDHNCFETIPISGPSMA